MNRFFVIGSASILITLIQMIADYFRPSLVVNYLILVFVLMLALDRFSQNEFWLK